MCIGLFVRGAGPVGGAGEGGQAAEHPVHPRRRRVAVRPQLSCYVREVPQDVLRVERIVLAVVQARPFARVLASDILEVVPVEIADRAEVPEHAVDLFVKRRRLSAGQLPRVLPIDVAVVPDIEQGQERRQVIDGANQPLDPFARKSAVGMPDDQRDVRDTPIQQRGRLLHATFFAEVRAVIGRKNDDRVVQQSQLLDLV